MRKHRGKVLAIVCILLSTICITINAYAHAGRTDSSGGHRDNRNKSGLGGYHYHCGGHPAHLHKNGVCPYSPSKKTNSSSSLKKSSKSATTSSKKATTVVKATSIQINKNVSELEIGDSRYMTATISPSNTNDKSIQWKSSDESIATINQEGVITARKYGTVTITASTTNGKTNTVKINITERAKEENNTNTITAIQNNIENITTTTSNTISGMTNNMIDTVNTTNITNTTIDQVSNHIKTNIEKESKKDTNPIGGILALGLLGGGGYLGYKKYKTQK